jgi:hypothetical protein
MNTSNTAIAAECGRAWSEYDPATILQALAPLRTSFGASALALDTPLASAFEARSRSGVFELLASDQGRYGASGLAQTRWSRRRLGSRRRCHTGCPLNGRPILSVGVSTVCKPPRCPTSFVFRIGISEVVWSRRVTAGSQIRASVRQSCTAF